MFLTEDFFPEFSSGKKFSYKNFFREFFSLSRRNSAHFLPKMEKKIAHFTRRAKLPPFDIYSPVPKPYDKGASPSCDGWDGVTGWTVVKKVL